MLRAADIQRQLGCSRSAAYAHLRRAAGRSGSGRTRYSVSDEEWAAYVSAHLAPDAIVRGPECKTHSIGVIAALLVARGARSVFKRRQP